MEYFDELVTGKKTIFVNCRQWGDTGKGKIVDLLTAWADVIARGSGGDNAGHTISWKGQELVTHLVPSGILHNHEGKINIIGSGTVIYPRTLHEELKALKERGITYNRLRIAYNAHLITPAEILLDRMKESAAGLAKIGSTGKGIGPAYADFVARQGLIINDLLNPDFFKKKLKRHLNYYKRILKGYDHALIKEVLNHEHLESGWYYDAQDIINLEAVYVRYLEYGQEFRNFITDTDAYIRSVHGKLNILGEGAQGDLLSIHRGSYPFVTSSDCGVTGLATGIGLTKNDVDLALGIIKGFYMTRVGNGPFPTELGGVKSDDWCNNGGMDESKELEKFGHMSVNDINDEFSQGVALRQAGGEYGATTGRPRRVGWLDLPLLRYTLAFNNSDIVLTKLDVLDDFKVIKICVDYVYEGPAYYLGDRMIAKGDILDVAIPTAEVLEHCRPLYKSFPGWRRKTSGCRTFDDLPSELKTILDFIVTETGAKPRIISIGADREATILVR